MTAALVVGILAAAGTYLVLQRGIVRITLGFVLIGHAATTALLAAGGVARRGIPFVGGEGTPGDPLPQAFALTAIVISFGVTAFLLTLAYRARDTIGTDDVEAPDPTPRSAAPGHRDDTTSRPAPTDVEGRTP
ncbi:MAG: NADH-quinone oxidoreductase subunit K [Nitriliruptor sp.]